MISSFFIQNFRSILELKLDFSYGEGKAPNGYQEQEIMPFIETTDKQRFVPCMAFFGANASGKTNLLMALGTLTKILSGSKLLSEFYQPNLLSSKFSHTTFDIEFFLEAERFRYRIVYNSKEILEEVLLKNEKPIYSISSLVPKFSSQLLSEAYSKEKLSDILRVECSDGNRQQIKPFLSCIAKGYPGLHSDLRNAFVFFKGNLKYYSNNIGIPLLIFVKFLGSQLNGDEKTALHKITDVVRRLDIDIDAINITQKKLSSSEDMPYSLTWLDKSSGDKFAVQITSTHQDISGKTVQFDFIKNESAGTQRLASLVGLVLYTLKTGGILLVDELECSLHPLLIREILMMFKKRRFNSNGAQIFFSTHNTDILDDSILRLSEVALVRKTKANGTLVRRLIDIKKDGEDIRNVTNFRKQYLAGFYSGIPHPAL